MPNSCGYCIDVLNTAKRLNDNETNFDYMLDFLQDICKSYDGESNEYCNSLFGNHFEVIATLILNGSNPNEMCFDEVKCYETLDDDEEYNTEPQPNPSPKYDSVMLCHVCMEVMSPALRFIDEDTDLLLIQ